MTIPFKRLQWLFPLAVLLHNGEEAIWMPGWTGRHAAQLPSLPAAEIRIALAVLSMAAFLVTYFSVRKGPDSLPAYLLFGSVVAMLANVFIPHIPASIVFRSYTPGVVTAVAINLPVMSVLAIHAVRERWVYGRKAVMFGVGVALVLAGLIAGLLIVGSNIW